MKLDKEQERAVTCDDQKILCTAGAGSGKTYTLINRIQRIIDEQKALPCEILVLTFTNAAADEMSTRFKAQAETDTSPEFKTFHGFCYSLICQDIDIRKALNYKDIPDICEDYEYKEITEKVKHDCNIKLSKKILNSTTDKELSPKEAYDKARFYKCLDKTMQKQNKISFDMMSRLISDLFVDNDNLILGYKSMYKYIFVDEFQDTDPLQWHFVKSFQDANIFLTGDISQAIYGFRGADRTIMEKLLDDKEYTNIQLSYNYRSVPTIVNFANGIVMDSIGSLRMHAVRSDKGYDEIKEYAVPHVTRELGYIFDQIKDHRLDGASTAILARTNAEVDTIKAMLTGNGLSFDESNSIKSYIQMKIFESVFDDSLCLSWISSQLDAQNYCTYLRLKATAEINGLEYTLKNFLTDFKTKVKNKELVSHIEKVFEIRKLMRSEKTPEEKCIDLLYILEVSNVIAQEDKEKLSDPQGFIDYIKEVIQSRPESDLYVGTIHSVKGLEFDNVILTGVDGRSFSLKSTENVNLYYVGVTRAKDKLIIIKYNDERRNQSKNSGTQ